jgi:decaprenylphospho-beta-D-erythro-pentofuranosid-2-ulose 2-reductase
MKTALILGAKSDIAIALAKKFAEQQYNIQLAARRPAHLKVLQSEIKIRYKVSCTIHEFDAIQYYTHHEFFGNLIPKPDVVISIFGATENEYEAFNDWEIAQRMINTNYTGVVSILNIVSKHYIGQKKGTIIGISSIAGDRGKASTLVYGSSKAALNTYLAGLRNKCFKENVHVMTVKPGFVYTRMTTSFKLPKILTATPTEFSEILYCSYQQKKDVVYVKWFWKYIMLMVKCIPEFQFKKMK